MVHGRTQASTRGRRAAPGIAVATLMFLGVPSTFALDPSLDVSQYAHTAWRIRDGFTRGAIHAIAQTPDGYLWLGTEFGLLRFDGVRAVPWQPPGEQLPSDEITNLLVARDGTLWIGTSKGLASWKDDKLTQYPEFAGQRVSVFRQGRDGTVWFGTLAPARLCVLEAGKFQCQGDGAFGLGIWALYEDHLRNLWVAAQTGLWRWKPGPPEHYSLPPTTLEAADLIEDESGALLLATNDGVKRLAGGTIQSHSLPGLNAVSLPRRFFRSSDGSLWIVAQHSLLHLHQGKADVFGAADSLSGEGVHRIYEDREGNIWVGTSGGLDRFREYTFPSISAKQGLSSSTTWSVLAAPDGTIWISASDGLNRWQNGHVTFHGKQVGSLRNQRSALMSSGTAPVLDGIPQWLALDDQRRLWTATKDGVLYLEPDRFVRVPRLPGGVVWSIAPDGHGNTWVSNADGLFYWAGVNAVQQFPWTQFGQKKVGAVALLPDSSQGGLWLGFFDGGVSYFKEGRVLASYNAADGLGAGRVSHLRFGEQDTVWAATEGGLGRIHDGHVLTLTAKNGLPCDAVHWSIEDDEHSAWLYMPCGLVRVARSELEAWVSEPKRTIQATVFDAAEGIRTVGSIGSYGPHVTKAPDGKIWFTSVDGITLVDPRHLRRNDLPPPVHIEQITADGKVYDVTATGSGRLRLPPRVRDLVIDYTALSLVVPEKVRFLVKLEGQDKDWREPVNPRHVNYTNLPPKDYRFLVKACNNSGVWNEEGAFLDFRIAPAFNQTAWFRGLCIVAAVAVLWGAYRIRIGVLERRQRLLEQHQRLLERHQTEVMMLNERLMKAQEEERTRIAGELHDGVLQQLTAASLNLGAAKRKIPPDSPAKTEVFGVETTLMQIGKDIRQLSHELHPSVLQESGLPKALSSYCGEFSKTRGILVSCEAGSDVKELSPGAALALYRIAQEALGNVAKHSRAKQVHVRLTRVDGRVRLVVSDDGDGFVPGGDSGGVGLINMRERVRQLNGTLELESQPGHGTTIRAEVPFR